MVELVYERDNGSEAVILFDATLSEEHRAEAEITEHPVERGANVSDHIRPKLERLRLDVHVTNTPIRDPRSYPNKSGAQPVDLAGGAVLNLSNQEIFRVEHSETVVPAHVPPGPTLEGRVGFDEFSFRFSSQHVAPAIILPREQVFGVTTRKFDREFDRVKLVHDTLVQHRTQGTMFRVLTSMREYERLVINSITAPRSVEDGDAVTISIRMKEIRIGRVQIAENAPDAPQPEPRAKRSKKKKDKGDKPTQEESSSQQDKNSSLANDVIGDEAEGLGEGINSLFTGG